MITNSNSIVDKYKCSRLIMEYLVYQCHLPVLSVDADSFYFAKTNALQEALKKMPFMYKFMSFLTK